MPFVVVKPVIDYSVRSLCFKPYPGHKKGCPNYNKCTRCPPQSKLIKDIFNLDEPVYLIYNKFSLWEHVDRMRTQNPSWSDRQLYCCLYWQGKARKQLREQIRVFKKSIGSTVDDYIVLDTPEATGVNVTDTMLSIDIKLEWPPRNFAYQVALAGKTR